MKERALKIDNDLYTQHIPVDEIAFTIRRLVEELDKKSKPVNHYEPTAWINHIKQTGGDFYDLNVSGRGEPLYRHPPQTKPLSDEEIIAIRDSCYVQSGIDEWEFDDVVFARAIEERHGIK